MPTIFVSICGPAPLFLHHFFTTAPQQMVPAGHGIKPAWLPHMKETSPWQTCGPHPLFLCVKRGKKERSKIVTLVYPVALFANTHQPPLPQQSSPDKPGRRERNGIEQE